MKLVPALEYEKQRQTTEDYAVILLNKDGKFYHAYNISAFILKNYVPDLAGKPSGVVRDARGRTADHSGKCPSDPVLLLQ